MKKRKMLKTWLLLGIGLIAVSGFVTLRAAEEMPKPPKEGHMMDMQKHMMKCPMDHGKCMQSLTETMTLLDEAITAVDAGNMADAKMKIEQAKMMLKNMQAENKKCMEKMPTCNAQCPISGKPIDLMDLPEDRTRMYHGKKVGFCCTACPLEWDKLTDEQKAEKLKEAMPKMPEKKDMMEKMHDEMKMHKETEDMM